MTPKQSANALLSAYISLYEGKYGDKPTRVNRFRDQWGFLDMQKDLGYQRCLEVLSYYFETSKIGHPLDYLFYNYEKYDRMMKEIAEDEANREQIRQETRRRVEEMEKRGNE